jgi:hypothetical protein
MNEKPTTINSFSIVRNPYERLVALYLDSWVKIGFGPWLESQNIKPQADLIGKNSVIHLENLEEELSIRELDPSGFKDIPKVTEHWQRWYDDVLLEQVEPIVKKDLLTFGYYRFKK